MRQYIDLRSDTVTQPTPEMRKAMAEAEVGDDVYNEDPTVRRLQDRAAELFGREAALFVPSGTMGNQTAVKIHTRPGQEVVMESSSHIFNYELAMMAAFSGCQVRPVPGTRGHLSWEQIETALIPDIYYRAPTGLVTLENTHNMGGGSVMQAEQIRDICGRVHERNLPVHLDGARIFNASVATGTGVAELTKGCDSVMFCLSKGLSAPVGSMLAGSEAFIREAWRVRKMLGGGMRQVGVLAAAGLVALETMPERLHVDHSNARFLAERLAEFPGIRVQPELVETNIVLVDLETVGGESFLAGLRERGVLAGLITDRQVRFVTHKDVSRQDVKAAAAAIGESLREL